MWKYFSAALCIALVGTVSASLSDQIPTLIQELLPVPFPAPAPLLPFLPATRLAPTFSGSGGYAEILALVDSRSGPVIYKTAHSMTYLFDEKRAENSANVTDQYVVIEDFGSVYLSYANNSLVMAFNATRDKQTQLLDATEDSFVKFDYLSEVVPDAQVASGVMKPFQDLVSKQSLDLIISNVTDGAIPNRIILTGYGAGGAMAQIAAIWSSLHFTQSHIRCITFGAPAVMNDKAVFAFQNFIDLSYIWDYNGEELVNTILRTVDSSDPTVNGDYDFNEYVQVLLQAGRFFWGLSSDNKPYISYERMNAHQAEPTMLGLLSKVGEFEAVVDGSGPSIAPTPLANLPNLDEISEIEDVNSYTPTDCPPILCKIRVPAQATCGTYYANVDGQVVVPINEALPNATYLTASLDTAVTLTWNSSTKVASMIWRGTQTPTNWEQNFKVRLVNGDVLIGDKMSQIFTNFQVHSGFLEQFGTVGGQNVTNSSTYGLSKFFDEQLSSEDPELVICAGHSLGGALAAICGFWASNKFPAADVRVVTMGQPFTGNQDFIDAYEMVNGRAYRIVHEMDLVTAIPPGQFYKHIGLGIFEHNGQVMLTDRPTVSMADLQWSDHSCPAYTKVLESAKNVAIPENAVIITRTA